MAPTSPSERDALQSMSTLPQEKNTIDHSDHNGNPSDSRTSEDSVSSSRSSSPSSEEVPRTAFSESVPYPVASFFSSVSLGGFPEEEEKSQPWRALWKEPKVHSKDGKLLVACPKRCVYGSNNLGGY